MKTHSKRFWIGLALEIILLLSAFSIYLVDEDIGKAALFIWGFLLVGMPICLIYIVPKSSGLKDSL